MGEEDGPSMVGRTLPRRRFRRSSLGVAGAGIALVALVLVPSALVAGLIAGLPPSSGRPPMTGGGGVSVAISVRLVCEPVQVTLRAATCPPMPNTLEFSATLSGGASASVYLWSFGDGTVPAFGQTVQHTFPGCALFTVSVLAFGGGGTVTNSTTLYPCPV